MVCGNEDRSNEGKIDTSLLTCNLGQLSMRKGKQTTRHCEEINKRSTICEEHFHTEDQVTIMYVCRVDFLLVHRLD